jgi:hypothetical protein
MDESAKWSAQDLFGRREWWHAMPVFIGKVQRERRRWWRRRRSEVEIVVCPGASNAGSRSIPPDYLGVVCHILGLPGNVQPE